MRLRTLSDKSYWLNYFKLAWPMSLQFLLSNSLGLVDTLLIGQLGDKALGALQVSNQFALLVIIISFGVSSGAGVFAAQYWGAKDLQGLVRIQGLSLMVSVGLSLIPLSLALFAGTEVMNFYSPDPSIIELGSTYVAISSFGFPLIAISMSFSTVLRSMGKVKMPLAISIITVILNVIFNVWFIFGGLGLPPMGIAGSALGTLLARVFESASLFILSIVFKLPNIGPVRWWFSATKDKISSYLKIALPVIGNEFGWAFGTSMISAIMARSSVNALPALAISDTVAQFVQMFLFSSINATAVIIGNVSGEGRLKRAFVLSRRSMVGALGIGIFCCLGLLGLSQTVPLIFKIDESIRKLATNFILILAGAMIIRSLLYHLTVGVFRGGGSTRLAFFLEVGGMWLLSIPVGALISLVVKSGSEASYAGILYVDIFILIIAFVYWSKAKWMKKVV